MYHIIVNPIAGRGRTLEHLPFLTSLFEENNVAFCTHTTTCVMDGYERAKEICTDAAACDGILGIGGDGTFQEIAAGMLNAFGGAGGLEGTMPVPLGIFPAGSGNDFNMTLEGGKKASLLKYGKDAEQNARFFFDKILRGKTQSVDLIAANGMAYLNVGNIGLDARIVCNAAAMKKAYGRRSYLASVYKSIVQHKNLPLCIEVNGEKLEKQYTLVAACNGQYYGGGMRVAPHASLTDGKITLCLVEAMSRPKIMVLFPSLMMERHDKLKAVKFLECESLKVTLPCSETLCLDGNLYPVDNSVEYKILPEALRVFM